MHTVVMYRGPPVLWYSCGLWDSLYTFYRVTLVILSIALNALSTYHGEDQRFIVWQATNPDSNMGYCWWVVYCLKEAQRQRQDQLKLQFRNTVVQQHYAFVMCIFCGPDHNPQPQLVLPVVHWLLWKGKDAMLAHHQKCIVLFKQVKKTNVSAFNGLHLLSVRWLLKDIIYILGLLFYCCTLCRYSKPKQLRCAIFCMASKKKVIPSRMVISFWRSVCNKGWDIFVTTDLSAQLCPGRKNVLFKPLWLVSLLDWIIRLARYYIILSWLLWGW